MVYLLLHNLLKPATCFFGVLFFFFFLPVGGNSMSVKFYVIFCVKLESVWHILQRLKPHAMFVLVNNKINLL